MSFNVSLTTNGPENDFVLNFTNITTGYMPLCIQVIYFTYVTFIFISGIPGNLMIMLVYGRSKTKKACDWFILFIGVTDFGVCIVSPILCVHTELAVEIPYINSIMCGLEHVWQLAGMTASCLILTVLSMERYIRVCHTRVKPLSPLVTRNISIACLVISLCAAVYPSLPQFKKDICYHLGSLEAATSSTHHYVYFSIFLVCLLTVVFTYGRVILTLERQIKVKQRMANDSGLRHDSGKSQSGSFEKPRKKCKWKCDHDDTERMCSRNSSIRNDPELNQMELTERIRTDNNSERMDPELSRIDLKEIGNVSNDKGREDNGYTSMPSNANDKDCIEDERKSNSTLPSKAPRLNSNNGTTNATDNSDAIHITVNPLFSDSPELGKTEGGDDHLEQFRELTGNDVKRKASMDEPNALANAQTRVVNDVLDGGDLTRGQSPSKTVGVKGQSSRTSSSSETTKDGELDEPKDFFQKAKKAMNDLQDKIVNHSKTRGDHGKRKKWIRERQVTVMLLCVTTVFICTWIPAWFLYLTAAEGILLFPPGVVTRVVYRYCDKIFLLNYISNFTIYYRFNLTFRRKAKAVLPRWVRKYCMICCLRNLDNESQV